MVDAVDRLESFRVLKPNAGLEIFKALKVSNFESFRALKLSYRTHIVATKLGIILLLSFHILPNLRLAKGPERSRGL